MYRHKVECAHDECSAIDLVMLVATVLGAVLTITVLRPSPEEAIRRFHHPGDVAEDQLTCPLILAGPRACPAILKEVKRRTATRFAYAIGALGSLRCGNAAAYLNKVTRDEGEKPWVRGQALEALWLIEEPPPEELARSVEARPDTLGRIAKDLLHRRPQWTLHAWDAVWCPHN